MDVNNRHVAMPYTVQPHIIVPKRPALAACYGLSRIGESCTTIAGELQWFEAVVKLSVEISTCVASCTLSAAGLACKL